MTDPAFLAAALLANSLSQLAVSTQAASWQPPPENPVKFARSRTIQAKQQGIAKGQPALNSYTTEFSGSLPIGPRSGSQLYVQRLAALQAGKLYTRLPIDSFRDLWSQASRQPTYQQWRQLLTLEAKAVANGQGNNRLAVIVGDSLSMWFPSDRLPSEQLWLNQAISGDTTRGMLQRLGDFAATRPHVIYVMAGVNDLKAGVSDAEILGNLQQIVRRLRQSHPQARLVLQSILPTRVAQIPNQRIVQINRQLATIARRHNAVFLNLHSQFAALDGAMQPTYTTDGVHLSDRGYATWQLSLQWAEQLLAQRG
jgi:lysophospholipase L1-like esterase